MMHHYSALLIVLRLYNKAVLHHYKTMITILIYIKQYLSAFVKIRVFPNELAIDRQSNSLDTETVLTHTRKATP
jgi:hypothetical protein